MWVRFPPPQLKMEKIEPSLLIYTYKGRFKKMYYTVYKITNLVNNKIYIGVHKTSNLNDNYMGSGNIIKQSIKKYGAENFKKEYISIFDNDEEMFKMESELVNKSFIKEETNYNIKEGGFGGWSYVNNSRTKEEMIEHGKKYGPKAGSWNNYEKRLKILESIPMEKRKEIGKRMGDVYGGFNKLTNDEINNRLNLIKNIDLMKYGWVKKVSEKLNISHTQVRRFIEKYYDGEFYERK